MACPGQHRIPRVVGDLQHRGSSAALAREEKQALEPLPVHCEAGVVGVCQRHRDRFVVGDGPALLKSLSVPVLDAQENVRAVNPVVAQVHFDGTKFIPRPVVPGVLTGRVGVVRPLQYADCSGRFEVEPEPERAVCLRDKDGRGVAGDLVGVTVGGEIGVFEVGDANAFAGETDVEQHAAQPPKVLVAPALVGAELAFPLAQLPLIEVGLERPLVEVVPRSDLDDHEDHEGQGEERRYRYQQPPYDVGRHGRTVPGPRKVVARWHGLRIISGRVAARRTGRTGSG